MKNLQRQKSLFVKKIVQAVREETEEMMQNNFKLKSYKLGGRDEDYLQFNFENNSVSLDILFWIKGLFEEIDKVTYFCFDRKDSQIEKLFEGSLQTELFHLDLSAKVRLVLKRISDQLIN